MFKSKIFGSSQKNLSILSNVAHTTWIDCARATGKCTATTKKSGSNSRLPPAQRHPHPHTKHKKPRKNKTLEWRKVTFSGTPVVKHLFLLDHRWHDHQPGYALMSIVKRPDQLPILVQWGWIAKNHPKNSGRFGTFDPAKT